MSKKSFSLKFEGYMLENGISSLPTYSGVYCVYECTYNRESVSIHQLIYIGESDNINNRISNHEKFNIWKEYVRDGNQLCFSYVNVASIIRNRVEAALIYHHKPVVNTEYVDNFPFDTTEIVTSGRNALLSALFTVNSTVYSF